MDLGMSLYDKGCLLASHRSGTGATGSVIMGSGAMAVWPPRWGVEESE